MARKKRCPKCKRQMLVEYDTHEECTSDTCTYYIHYGDYDDEYKEAGSPWVLGTSSK